MKTIKFIFFIIVFSGTRCVAQDQKYKNDLSIYYNWKYIGNTISIDYCKNVYQNSFVIGAQMYLNQIPNVNGYPFKDKAYAYGISERFGLNIGYKYIIKNENILKIFVSSNIQYSNIRFRIEDGNNLNDYGIIALSDLTDRHNIFELLLGVGINIKIYKNVYFMQSVFVGKSFLSSKNYGSRFNNTTSYRYGITYQFGKNLK